MEAMSSFEYVPAGLVRFVRETETECDCFTKKHTTEVCSRQLNHKVISIYDDAIPSLSPPPPPPPQLCTSEKNSLTFIC